MAYNIKETVTTLRTIEVGTRGDKVLITKHVKDDDGAVSFDARKWYTPEGGELTPTKFGVRLSESDTVDSIISIISELTPESKERLMDFINKENAVEDALADFANVKVD